MAGIAEAALAFEVFVIYGTALLIGFLASVAIIRRMPVVAGVSVFLVVLSTLVISPWVVYDFQPNEDPDWNGFIGSFQNAAAWWFVASILAVISLAFTMIVGPRKDRSESDDTNSSPTANLATAITAHADIATAVHNEPRHLSD
jgi:hypothetical protein